MTSSLSPENGSAGEPVALLRRYRSLCEASGLARAHRLTLAAQIADELTLIETRLIEMLGTPPTTITETGSESEVEQTIEKIDDPVDIATVFTDGSAEGNPGPGGYCALVRIAGRPDRELSGGTNHTTNNKMELTAALVGLQAAVDAGATDITIVSDSEYLVKGMTRWLPSWLARGWRTADGQPVKNQELWEQLDALSKSVSVTWQWIRGHAGHPENERCDSVATAAARQAGRR